MPPDVWAIVHRTDDPWTSARNVSSPSDTCTALMASDLRKSPQGAFDHHPVAERAVELGDEQLQHHGQV